MRDTRPQHDPARQGHRCFTGDPSVARVAAGSALELHGVVREWRVGAGRCLARVRALRGVSLTVRAGEIVAVTGGAGAGKTTLLLCAAGIVRADAGLVRQPALGCAAYIGPHDPEWARHALAAVDHGVGALLLDVLDGPACASARAVATVAGSAARAGLAVVVAAREASALPAFASRLLELRDGRLVASTQPLAGRWPGARAVAASLPLAPCRP